MEINLKDVKGRGTKDTGMTVLVLSIVAFGILQLAIFSIKDGYVTDQDLMTIELLSTIAPNLLISGILIGIVISALGQIMLNTGTTAKIQEELAKNKGFKLKH